MSVKLKISPPWITYINKLQALFDGDPLIAFNVNYGGNNENPSVTLTTNDGEKGAALVNVLPEEKVFGNVTLDINIDCPNISNRAFVTPKELFETLFKGNPAFAYTVVPENYWFVPFTYIVFKNHVVQFFNDNLNDPHGVLSTLYQDIAEEIFKDNCKFKTGVAYCTDIEQKLNIPLGEWP